MNQQQDHRRLQPPDQGQNLHQPPQAPPPPEKCPRCDSENTKFCYYNNYSLSQPRYYCKNCRRYWTQGGTLRNVPVGGGCRRKPKRSKTSTTSSTNSENLTTQPITTPLHLSQNLTTMASVISGNSGLLPVNQTPASLPPTISPMVSFYTSGSFLSMQPGGQLGGGAAVGGGANMAQFQGLNLPSLETQSSQFRLENELLPPQRTFESWSQILVNNSATSSASNPNFWSNTGSGGNGGGSSINPNQWPDQ